MLKNDEWIRKMVVEHRMITPFVDRLVSDGVISYGLSSYGYDFRIANEFKILRPPVTDVKPMSEAGAAWVAGIIDGEGYIKVQHDRRNPNWSPYLRVVVGMTDKTTIDMLHQMTGIGNVRQEVPDNPNHSPVWYWDVSTGKHVKDLLRKVFPYMVTKRKEAMDAISTDISTDSFFIDPKASKEEWFTHVTVEPSEPVAIPANSFVLARTVEYFRIPRNILALCVGKSTMARCGILVNITPAEPTWEGFLTLEISNTTPVPALVYANEGIAQMIFLEADEVCRVSYADRKGKYQGQTGIVTSRV